MDLAHGPGEVFGLLTFLGVVLVLYGYSDEGLRRRSPARPRRSISGTVKAAGKVQVALGTGALTIGVAGLLVLWAVS